VISRVDALVTLMVRELAARRRTESCHAEFPIATLLRLAANELPAAPAEAVRRHVAECVMCLNAFVSVRVEFGRMESASRRRATLQREQLSRKLQLVPIPRLALWPRSEWTPPVWPEPRPRRPHAGVPRFPARSRRGR
jgi:hypothetical protein